MSLLRRPSTQFKKDLKRIVKRGYKLNKLEILIDMLAEGKALPARLRNHKLVGNYIGYSECHIESDWVLIYYCDDDVLYLVRTGTHADLFNK